MKRDVLMNRRFELRIIPRKDDNIGLSLLQLVLGQDDSKEKPKDTTLYGLPLKVMMETLLTTLKKQGYRPTEFSPQRKEPFKLDEVSGVRLGVLFYALRPLRKPSRMEQIIAEINCMSDEEVYYWYSKCSDKINGRRSQRSLRILLSDE